MSRDPRCTCPHVRHWVSLCAPLSFSASNCMTIEFLLSHLSKRTNYGWWWVLNMLAWSRWYGHWLLPSCSCLPHHATADAAAETDHVLAVGPAQEILLYDATDGCTRGVIVLKTFFQFFFFLDFTLIFIWNINPFWTSPVCGMFYKWAVSLNKLSIQLDTSLCFKYEHEIIS